MFDENGDGKISKRELIRAYRIAGFNPTSQEIEELIKEHDKNGNHITKTRLYNFDPLKPHFYIVKLGFTGVYIIFLISAKKHRLWVLVRTASTRRF